MSEREANDVGKQTTHGMNAQAVSNALIAMSKSKPMYAAMPPSGWVISLPPPIHFADVQL